MRKIIKEKIAIFFLLCTINSHTAEVSIDEPHVVTGIPQTISPNGGSIFVSGDWKDIPAGTEIWFTPAYLNSAVCSYDPAAREVIVTIVANEKDCGSSSISGKFQIEVQILNEQNIPVWHSTDWEPAITTGTITKYSKIQVTINNLTLSVNHHNEGVGVAFQPRTLAINAPRNTILNIRNETSNIYSSLTGTNLSGIPVSYSGGWGKLFMRDSVTIRPGGFNLIGEVNSISPFKLKFNTSASGIMIKVGGSTIMDFDQTAGEYANSYNNQREEIFAYAADSNSYPPGIHEIKILTNLIYP